MSDFHRALERIRVHGETVILGRDLDFSRGHIHHRLVAAVMTEFELEGLAAQGQAHDLVPEADTEDRFLADELLHVFPGVGNRVGIAGTVGKKDAVGIQWPRTSAAGSVRRNNSSPGIRDSARLRRMLYLMPKS